MPAIRHVLFPLDFSSAGLAATPYVRTLANQFHAKVTVLSVVPPAWVTPPGLIPPPVGSDPAALQSALQTHLDKLPLDGFEQPVTRVTALGDPAVKIAEFSRDGVVDLVMLPTHGHGLFRGLLLGSVTSKVLHDVHSPVWTAAHAAKQRARRKCLVRSYARWMGAKAVWRWRDGRSISAARWARACNCCMWCGPLAIGWRSKASRHCRRNCEQRRVTGLKAC